MVADAGRNSALFLAEFAIRAHWTDKFVLRHSVKSMDPPPSGCDAGSRVHRVHRADEPLNDVKLSRVALDRAQVIGAAIELLDEVGLDGLTLRRLAEQLGVQAPALYWHFKNKQELLDQMVVAISAAEAPVQLPDAGQSWDDWLARRARDIRRSLNSHRDGAMLAASAHPQPSQWRDIEAQISALAEAGMRPADAMRAMLTVGNYVSGFTLEEQSDRLRGSLANDLDPAEFEKALRAFADYPRLSDALREVGDPRSDSAFEAGLEIVLDGLRARAQRSANGSANGSATSAL
jgi:TetR/AcrR family transcriptional regulator, tetracycline repressor protein